MSLKAKAKANADALDSLGVLAKTWSLNFYPIDDALAALYRQECGKDFWHFSDHDFASAVRWLAHSKDRPAYPKASDLWRACKELDKQRVKEQADIDGRNGLKTCAMCMEGWVRYWPEMREPYTFEKTFTEVAVAIPCGCSDGERVRERVYKKPWSEPKDLPEKRTLAFAQIKAINEDARRPPPPPPALVPTPAPANTRLPEIEAIIDDVPPPEDEYPELPF